MASFETRLLNLVGAAEGSSLSDDVVLFVHDLDALIQAAATGVAFIGYDGTGAERVKAQLSAMVARAKGEA
ncbi:MAG: hypothetical protein V4641_05795 [Pseudomonadota bacterium]